MGHKADTFACYLVDRLLLVEHMLKDWRRWFTFSDGDKDTLRE